MKKFFVDFDGWFEIYANDKENAKAEFMELWDDFILYCNKYDFHLGTIEVEEG